MWGAIAAKVAKGAKALKGAKGAAGAAKAAKAAEAGGKAAKAAKAAEMAGTGKVAGLPTDVPGAPAGRPKMMRRAKEGMKGMRDRAKRRQAGEDVPMTRGDRIADTAGKVLGEVARNQSADAPAAPSGPSMDMTPMPTPGRGGGQIRGSAGVQVKGPTRRGRIR